MRYKQITINFSLKGLSSSEIISEFEKEGYKALFSNLMKAQNEFLGLEDPFRMYDERKLQVTTAKSAEDILAYGYDVVRASEMYTRRRLGEILSIPTELVRRALQFGDLFRREKYPDVIFCLYEYGEDEIWFACWTTEGIELDELLDSFITTFFKVVGCEKPLEEIISSDTFGLAHTGMFDELKEYNLKEAALKEKRTTLEILSNEQFREILVEMSKKGNVLLSDYLSSYKGKERERKKKNLNFLIGQGFLTKALIVICTKTGQWWNVTVPSMERLKEIEDLGITCTSCGAGISKEKIDELYKISEKGKEMISGSYWMVERVVSELQKIGLREEDIFINVTHNGEEIDVVAFYMAQLVVFELKDREFGLGDAYRFHGKISRLREKAPRRSIYPIIATTKTVASEAKRLLEEVIVRETQYKFVEGLESLGNLRTEVFDDIVKQVISERMNNVQRRFPCFLLGSRYY